MNLGGYTISTKIRLLLKIASPAIKILTNQRLNATIAVKRGIKRIDVRNFISI